MMTAEFDIAAAGVVRRQQKGRVGGRKRSRPFEDNTTCSLLSSSLELPPAKVAVSTGDFSLDHVNTATTTTTPKAPVLVDNDNYIEFGRGGDYGDGDEDEDDLPLVSSCSSSGSSSMTIDYANDDETNTEEASCLGGTVNSSGMIIEDNNTRVALNLFEEGADIRRARALYNAIQGIKNGSIGGRNKTASSSPSFASTTSSGGLLDDVADLEWTMKSRSAQLDQAMHLPDEEVRMAYGRSGLSFATASSSSSNANAPSNGSGGLSDAIVAAARLENEICHLCKRPLVFSAHNESLVCPTEGCSPHVYSICDSTLASMAFGEVVDFTDAVAKPSHQAFKVSDQIFGKKTKLYVNQRIVDYMRICIQVSLRKNKASEITVEDVYACAKVHGWNQLYGHLTQLLCRITGRKAPSIQPHVEEQAHRLFAQIKRAFKGDRFMNCLYVWYKIFEILKQTQVLPFIRLVETKALAGLDAEFERICHVLGRGADFRPTVAKPKVIIEPLAVVPSSVAGNTGTNPPPSSPSTTSAKTLSMTQDEISNMTSNTGNSPAWLTAV